MCLLGDFLFVDRTFCVQSLTIVQFTFAFTTLDLLTRLDRDAKAALEPLLKAFDLHHFCMIG